MTIPGVGLPLCGNGTAKAPSPLRWAGWQPAPTLFPKQQADLYQAISAGADGYLLKENAEED
jgi:hypothetical protein